MVIDDQGGVSGHDREDRDAAGNLVPPEWLLKETTMMTAFCPALATRAIELARLQNSKVEYHQEKKKAFKDNGRSRTLSADSPR